MAYSATSSSRGNFIKVFTIEPGKAVQTILSTLLILQVHTHARFGRFFVFVYVFLPCHYHSGLV